MGSVLSESDKQYMNSKDAEGEIFDKSQRSSSEKFNKKQIAQ